MKISLRNALTAVVTVSVFMLGSAFVLPGVLRADELEEVRKKADEARRETRKHREEMDREARKHREEMDREARKHDAEMDRETRKRERELARESALRKKEREEKRREEHRERMTDEGDRHETESVFPAPSPDAMEPDADTEYPPDAPAPSEEGVPPTLDL